MIALDLFAGTGWGVACQWLGIEEHGVEIMPEAIATRTAAGMRTAYADVWSGLDVVAARDPLFSAYDLLIASPPCQTFSTAGKGAGRAALDEVLHAVAEGLYRDPAALRAYGAVMGHDDKTSLVLAPLAHVYRDRPTFVAFEQVPSVLPVWDACAAVMRGLGYSVWTGVLNAEQYGVPQTRRRAFLVARRDGAAAAPPEPTHSRYYSTRPHQLDMGVQPWVSMADALGWGEGVAGFPRRSDGREEVLIDGEAYRARDLRATDAPSQAVTEKARSWGRYMTGAGSASTTNVPRRVDTPAHTITGAGTADVHGRATVAPGLGMRSVDARRLTVDEVSVLQSYPADFPWQGSRTAQFLQVGNAVPPLLARAVLEVFTKGAHE